MILTDKEICMVLDMPFAPEVELGIDRDMCKAQLGKDIETIKAMPHGTTHCDIVQALLDEVKDV
jgi:hypothetical protein